MRLRSIFMKSWGFVPVGVRKGFNEKPKEDALIMWRRQMLPSNPCFQEYMCWFIISLYNGRGGENHAEL